MTAAIIKDVRHCPTCGRAWNYNRVDFSRRGRWEYCSISCAELARHRMTRAAASAQSALSDVKTLTTNQEPPTRTDP